MDALPLAWWVLHASLQFGACSPRPVPHAPHSDIPGSTPHSCPRFRAAGAHSLESPQSTWQHQVRVHGPYRQSGPCRDHRVELGSPLVAVLVYDRYAISQSPGPALTAAPSGGFHGPLVGSLGLAQGSAWSFG